MAASVRMDPTSSADAGHPLAPIPYVVRSVATETPDIVTLTLNPHATKRIPPFRPGQFNMVYVYGVGESAISISGGTSDGQLIHTVQSLGKVSNALTRLTPGDTLGVRGPYGRGWPIAEAKGRDLVIVAGGLGLPPLRPVLYEIFRNREAYGRIEIIDGARTPKNLVYYDEVQGWRRRSDLRIQVTVDAAGRDWYGDVGVVTTRIPDARFEPERTTAFICGPEIMLKLTAQALAARKVPADSIFISMERNMKCAIGLCGHCQFQSSFVCRDGPVFSYAAAQPLLNVKEV
ncbi:MAG TPA: FAD/NAD(P)-binding protein [Thermoplasmata archaeon]|nr:FAD/NAD(P)-binding protein [Thermoplasmata archaeon]